MARQRTVHPDFFTDARVVQVSPLARLLFIGIWCYADREGRLFDKPVDLKIRLLPFDTCDASALVDELVGIGILIRYVVRGVKLLAIPNFRKYQRPHPKEMPSKLPPPPTDSSADVAEAAENGSCMAPEPGKSGHEAGSFPSGLSGQSVDPEDEVPSARKQEPLKLEPTESRKEGPVERVFAHWQTVFGKQRSRLDDDRRAAIERGLALHDEPTLLKAIEGCRASAWHMGGNPAGKKYTTLELIFRDAEHVEGFCDRLEDSLTDPGLSAVRTCAACFEPSGEGGMVGAEGRAHWLCYGCLGGAMKAGSPTAASDWVEARRGAA